MPIYIGCKNKQLIINEYIKNNCIKNVFVITPKAFELNIEHEIVTYETAINYTVFYRLLQEINSNTLIVLNECLRTQNRYDLTYNCIRNYLNQTPHQLIFNQLPQINTQEDFMILFDFDTQSRWKREKFDLDLIYTHSTVFVNTPHIEFNKIEISNTVSKQYQKQRDKLFATLGNRDPHIIPRRLYLLAGKDKLEYVKQNSMPLFDNNETYYMARNKRLKHKNVHSYNEFDNSEKYTILEFQHRFIDFADFMRVNWQFEFDVVTTNLKVDQWYYQRYSEWGERINATCTELEW